MASVARSPQCASVATSTFEQCAWRMRPTQHLARRPILGARSHRNTTRSRRYASTSTHSLSASEVQSAEQYCTNLVQKYDRASYTLSTFIPSHARAFYLALRALNISLSQIPDTTSTPTIAAMRMQFWRDTITRTLDTTQSPPKEPIAILLAASISQLENHYSLASTSDPNSTLSLSSPRTRKSWFLRMITAREQYLTSTPYTTLSSLESYAESTYSTLLYLTLSSLSASTTTTDHLASHVGKAAGITTVLRGLPLLAFPQPPNHHNNQTDATGSKITSRPASISLPLDILAEFNVREEDIYNRAGEAQGLKDAVFAVATRASDHLITARTMLSSLRAGHEPDHSFEHADDGTHSYPHDSEHLPASDSKAAVQLKEVESGFGALMPAVATQMWLDQLQAVDFDVFDPRLRSGVALGGWRLPWKGYWAFRRKMF